MDIIVPDHFIPTWHPTAPPPCAPVSATSTLRPSADHKFPSSNGNESPRAEVPLDHQCSEQKHHRRSQTPFHVKKKRTEAQQPDSPPPATRRRLDDYSTEADRFEVDLAACASEDAAHEEVARIQRVEAWVAEQRLAREALCREISACDPSVEREWLRVRYEQEGGRDMGGRWVRRGEIVEFPILID